MWNNIKQTGGMLLLQRTTAKNTLNIQHKSSRIVCVQQIYDNNLSSQRANDRVSERERENMLCKNG